MNPRMILVIHNQKSKAMITLKQLSQDKVSMDMSILDTINHQVVNNDNIIRHLLLGTLLPAEQVFTLVMTKEVFKRISSLPYHVPTNCINISNVFDYTVNANKESDIISVKFTKL